MTTTNLAKFKRADRCLFPALFVAMALTVFGARADALASLTFTGMTTWDSATGTIGIASSGSMPDAKEGFFWDVPAEVKKIVIGRDVIVKGGFRIGYRNADNPLHIVGLDRKTSVIYGTNEERWTEKNGIDESDKWRYGAVNVLADAVVHVSNLTSENPRGYNISGYANQSVIHVSNCNLVDTRAGDNNNSDGFIGSAGSSIRDSFISTSDDGIKVYQDITIESVTIEQKRNGAPLQFGWGGETGDVTATITNLTINGVDPDNLYNMAPFTWEDGSSGTRNVVIDGLSVDIIGKMFSESNNSWIPVGLFELKPAGCTFNFQAINAAVQIPGNGVIDTAGKISINQKLIEQ